MSDKTDEVGPCKICGAFHKRSNGDDWYYHKEIVVCSHHHGVKEWYAEVLMEGN